MRIGDMRWLTALATLLIAKPVFTMPDALTEGGSQVACPSMCGQQCAVTVTSYTTITPTLTVTETEHVSKPSVSEPSTTIYPASTITIYTTITDSNGMSTVPLSTMVVPASTNCPQDQMATIVYTQTQPESTVTVYSTVTGASGPVIVTITSIIPGATTMKTSTISDPGEEEQTTVIYSANSGSSKTLAVPITTKTVMQGISIYPESQVIIYTTRSGSPTPIVTSIVPASTQCQDEVIETIITTYITTTSQLTATIPISTGTYSAVITTIYSNLNNTNASIPIITVLPLSSTVLYTTTCFPTTITSLTTITSTITLPHLTNNSSSPTSTCTPNNCLQQMLSSPAITSVCASLTAAPFSNSTSPTLFADNISQCNYDRAALKSACSCAIESSAPSNPTALISSSILPSQAGNLTLSTGSSNSTHCAMCSPPKHITGWETMIVTAARTFLTAARTSTWGKTNVTSTGQASAMSSSMSSASNFTRLPRVVNSTTGF